MHRDSRGIGKRQVVTARAIIRLLPDGVFARGAVMYNGQNMLELSERAIRRVRGTGISLLMQDPFTMLNPLMRVGEQITEAMRSGGRQLGKRMQRGEASRRLAEVEILDPTVADRYPFELSGGMRQRVGLAAALAGEPRLLIADEPSTALDVTTQKEVLKLLKSLQAARGMGLVLITHDLRVAFSVCDRVYVLYAGSVLEVAPSADLEREPLHPYSLGLLLSEAPSELRVERLYAVEGSVPAPDDVRGRCPFSPRCRWVAEPCTTSDVQLREIERDRRSACRRAEEIRGEMVVVRRESEGTPHLKTSTTQRESLVRVEDLFKTFGGKRSGMVKALAGVSMEIAAGESVGLVGESGSGKTTLGRCLVGLEKADSGKIVIDGVDASDYSRLSDSDRRRLRRTIQIVFQDPYSSLNPVRTIGATLREVVEIGRQSGVRNGAAGVGDLLELVGLPRDYAERKPGSLSGGERQRVAIARAFGMVRALSSVTSRCRQWMFRFRRRY